MRDSYDKSVEGICTFIWDLEKNYDLFSKTEQDVFFWRVIRFHLYYEITQKTEIFGAPHGNTKLFFHDYLEIVTKTAKSLLFRNPFLSNATYTNIVMPHSRQVNGVDIYSEQLIKSLDDKDTLILYGKDVPPNDTGTKNLAAQTYLSYLIAKTNKISISYETSQLLAEIESLVFKHWYIKINLRQIISVRVRRFKKDSQNYQKIFKKTKAKNLYIVVAYLNQAIIHAAQKCGMEVTELQHGIFTKYHLGYSFPVDSEKIPYFPNKLMTFGQFWTDVTPLPQNTDVQIIGAPYVQKLKEKLDTIDKQKKLVVFSSQGAIAKDLFPFSIKVANLLPDYEFIYRLHPSEDLDSYEEKIKKINLKNFALSHKTPNIFDLLASAEYQAGVFSTTLLEGIALKTKPVLIEMPGIEYMRSVVQKGDAILVSTPEEFKNNIMKAEEAKNSEYYYADIEPETQAKDNSLVKTQIEKIFICIISYNRPIGLKKLLDALAKQKKHKNQLYTICVVDNDCSGKNDEVISQIQSQHPIIIIKEPKKGIVAARNKGVEKFLNSDHDALIFIDDDEWPEENTWVENLVTSLEQSESDVVFSDVYTIAENNEKPWLEAAMGRKKNRVHMSSAKVFYTNNTIIKRNVLEIMGPTFDERFLLTGSSDYHFAIRCIKKGFIAKYTNAAPLKEFFPESKATKKWFFLRGYRTGNGATRSHLYTEPLPKVIARALLYTILRTGRASSTLLISTLTLNTGTLYKGIRELGAAIGTFTGLFGMPYEEYRKIHGE